MIAPFGLVNRRYLEDLCLCLISEMSSVAVTIYGVCASLVHDGEVLGCATQQAVHPDICGRVPLI